MPGLRPPIERAIAFVESAADADDLAWLARGFALAFREGASLDLALGLPSTPARWRTALRAYWLAIAAEKCTEASPWRRACELAKAGSEFEAHTWPDWRRRDFPPSDASALQRALFYLCRHGGHVPRARRLHDLLTATLDRDIAAKVPLSCREHPHMNPAEHPNVNV